MWTANFLSSIGTWMQNVVLPAYVYQRTSSASIVGLFIFAQLGPLLLLSVPAGVLADRFDRRRWLVFAQIVQMTGSVFLGVFTIADAPVLTLFLAQMTVGVGNAFNAPAFSAVLPSLVRPEDLGGSISLSSASVNGSRVTAKIAGMESTAKIKSETSTSRSTTKSGVACLRPFSITKKRSSR